MYHHIVGGMPKLLIDNLEVKIYFYKTKEKRKNFLQFTIINIKLSIYIMSV